MLWTNNKIYNFEGSSACFSSTVFCFTYNVTAQIAFTIFLEVNEICCLNFLTISQDSSTLFKMFHENPASVTALFTTKSEKKGKLKYVCICRNVEGVAKKREEWVKNWVARKYNKPKFPRGPVPLLSGSQVHTIYLY